MTFRETLHVLLQSPPTLSWHIRTAVINIVKDDAVRITHGDEVAASATVARPEDASKAR